MKLTILSFLISTLSLIAGESYSQNTRISLNMKNAQIKDVLLKIENSSEFFFIYNNQLIDVDKTVSINVNNEKMLDILADIFHDQHVEFQVNQRKIVIVPTAVMGQQRTIKISGKVTDSSGSPIPGASVVIKGTTNGIITNVDGDYSLSNIPAGSALVVSFVGMKTQEISVGNKAVINVTLTEETIGIEEVVAIGYGTQKKVNLTGSVSSVNSEELNKRPVTNPSSMLQGLIPGLQVIQGSGEPGNEALSIRIRGIGTFSNTGSSPLVLVDGIEGDLANLNPNNIESISVLKDAASASIYGSRAANGVIIVITKQGKEGRLNIEYNGSFEIDKATRMFKTITNSAEYMELWNEARTNSGLSSSLYTQQQIDLYRNATDRNEYPNTDWLDLIFRQAPAQRHFLSFNGGKEGTNYNVSLGYVNQEGIMKGFSYEKFNLRVNLKSQINSKIKFGTIIGLNKGLRKSSRDGSENLFMSAMSQAPTYSPKLNDGSGRYTFKAYDNEMPLGNPIALIENNTLTDNDNYEITAQGWVDVQISKSLSWYTKGAINGNFNISRNFRPTVPVYNFHSKEPMGFLNTNGNGLEENNERNIYTNLYTYLKFDKTFGNAHTINAQLGFSREENSYRYMFGYRQNFPSNLLREFDAGSPSVQSVTGSLQEWALLSYFGRLNYNYKERYLLETNLRYDGTSRISPDSRWGLFPSLSAGWRVTEEQFVKDMEIPWLNTLKLRGSFGKLGNQNIGLYPYQTLLSLTGNYSYDNSNLSSGVAQTDLSNPNIKWETTEISDIGLDLTIFEGLSMTFDWYKKTTTDILRSSQLTDAVGLNPPTINGGTMQNTGVEFNLTYNNQIKSGSFNGLKYSLGFNIDHFKNELVRFGAKEISAPTIKEEGKEWDAYYMLEWIGIFQTPDEVASSPKQFNDETVPGDLKFKDQNGDGKVDDADRIVMGGQYPDFSYAVNFNSSWKNFDLSFFFQGVNNVKYYVEGWGVIPFSYGAPPTIDWRDRWTESNHSTSLPRIYFGNNSPSKVTHPSSWYLQDASYLRLKNLTIGYTIPEKVLRKIRINNLRLFLSGDNLLTFTNYPGLDPERGPGSGNYFIHYPQNKVYSIGLNIKF